MHKMHILSLEFKTKKLEADGHIFGYFLAYPEPRNIQKEFLKPANPEKISRGKKQGEIV